MDKVTDEQWKELALWLRTVTLNPLWGLYQQIQTNRLDELTRKEIQSDSDNRYNRGKIAGMIEQNKEINNIIETRLQSEDTNETSDKENLNV